MILEYLSRWAVARRRRASLEAWSGIDRGVAPPLKYRPLPPITEEMIQDVLDRQMRWHEVIEIDPPPVRHRWLRDCYCADGKHGR